jgi:predicted N-acetyltransferase YhbS
MTTRELTRDEIPLVWTIDRSEVVDGVYRFDRGRLVLEPKREEVAGWPAGEAEKYTPDLYRCFDRGGLFLGRFEGPRLVGVVVLDTRFIGKSGDRLQLKMLYVSRPFRGKGIGVALFREAVDRARALGARRLYISATPTRHTVDFYQRLGCTLTKELDAELFAFEPEDIHFDYAIPPP